MSRPTILFAGGGTGGHVFPAIAVAKAIETLADVDIVFCGTARGIEARLIPSHHWHLELLDVEPMRGRGAAQTARASIVAARATIHALALVQRVHPCAVLSVGGYAAGPVALAGALRRIPLAVFEPNCVVGLTNRLLRPFAKRAYVAWDEAAIRFSASARRGYGVPLRPGFAPRPYALRGTARVLVMGGSQGAASLNERMPEAIARLGVAVQGLSVMHQAGHGREGTVRGAYGRRGVVCATVVPFLDDVGSAIAEADVVVARAGAGTIAEIAAIGRAAILVPLPHAADDHQGRNAEALARVGAAVCLREAAADSRRLGSEISRLLFDDSARIAMADAARARGKPGAARDVAMDLLALAGIDAHRHEAQRDVVPAIRPLDAEGR